MRLEIGEVRLAPPNLDWKDVVDGRRVVVVARHAAARTGGGTLRDCRGDADEGESADRNGPLTRMRSRGPRQGVAAAFPIQDQ